jgi:excinuclease ABC subunit A
MSFLPEAWVTCEECQGRRFNRDTLAVTWGGRSVADVLDLSVEAAADAFASVPAIARALGVMNEIGLGYLRLGQPSPELSGGEAQRVKLAEELARPSRGRTLYILDEPTTGLHMSDVARLVAALRRIVARGDTVIVIEHNLDVIAHADWMIDLGPEGGAAGGRVVASGTPAQVAQGAKTHTARALAAYLPKEHGGEVDGLGRRS